MPQQRKSGVYVPPEPTPVNATQQRRVSPVRPQQMQTTILTPTQSDRRCRTTRYGETVCDPLNPTLPTPPTPPPTPPPTGCSCEPCPPERIALGTCPPKCVDCEKPPEKCPTCPPDTIPKGVWGSILDPCRCEPPTPTPPPKSCECEACKNGTGECSDKRPCCNAWDLLCEAGGECSKTPPPEECGFFDLECKTGKWWDEYGIYVMVIGGLIGLGILLWLLRPLFSVIGAFKGGSP